MGNVAKEKTKTNNISVLVLVYCSKWHYANTSSLAKILSIKKPYIIEETYYPVLRGIGYGDNCKKQQKKGKDYP